MPFVDVVFGSESTREFSVSIGENMKVRHFKANLESTPSGKAIGFNAATWGLFLADNDGKKTGGELANDNLVSDGMKVWVECVQAIGAYSHELVAIFAFSRLQD